jgi:hypothetical protein
MRINMSAQAVTTRLKRASQLRRLCLSLGKAKTATQRESVPDEPTGEEQSGLGEERAHQPHHAGSSEQ